MLKEKLSALVYPALLVALIVLPTLILIQSQTAINQNLKRVQDRVKRIKCRKKTSRDISILKKRLSNVVISQPADQSPTEPTKPQHPFSTYLARCKTDEWRMNYGFLNLISIVSSLIPILTHP